MKQGQILIIVLLVVVVILAVGLSVASRNITNLRTSTQTEQSQRAFTAAEGGVEDVLSRISTIPSGSSLAIDVGGLTANVNVTSSPVYEQKITTEEVGQVDLTALGGNQVQIEWASNNPQSGEAPAEGPASIEVSLVYGSGVADYQVARWFFAGANPPAYVLRGNEVLGSNIANSTNSCTSSKYVNCMLVDLSRAPSYILPRILRIKPFWLATTARVSGDGFDLPPQQYEVKSTAATEIGVTRSVEVVRSALPHLPAVFDYALFSEGDIIK